MTVVDMNTGEEHQRPFNWHAAPVAPHLCQVCATDHDPLVLHNRDSVYYCIMFGNFFGRVPTWADAVAHCSDSVKEQCKTFLVAKGAWSEPPEGVAPIAHFGEHT